MHSSNFNHFTGKKRKIRVKKKDKSKKKSVHKNKYQRFSNAELLLKKKNTKSKEVVLKMLIIVMMFWIGHTLAAPVWYWWLWGIEVALAIIRVFKNFYDLGKKSNDF